MFDFKVRAPVQQAYKHYQIFRDLVRQLPLDSYPVADVDRLHELEACLISSIWREVAIATKSVNTSMMLDVERGHYRKNHIYDDEMRYLVCNFDVDYKEGAHG